MLVENGTVLLEKDLSVSVVDYIVLVSVLLFSLGIGIFYSYRQKTSEEYLHGGRQMALVPVSISLVVSFISAVTMQVRNMFQNDKLIFPFSFKSKLNNCAGFHY